MLIESSFDLRLDLHMLQFHPLFMRSEATVRPLISAPCVQIPSWVGFFISLKFHEFAPFDIIWKKRLRSKGKDWNGSILEEEKQCSCSVIHVRLEKGLVAVIAYASKRQTLALENYNLKMPRIFKADKSWEENAVFIHGSIVLEEQW